MNLSPKSESVLAFIDGLKLRGDPPEDWESYISHEFGTGSEDAQAYLDLWCRREVGILARLDKPIDRRE